MASFTIGDFRFETVRHERTVAGGVVKERFVIDLFFQNQPLSWHPNQTGADDYPGASNRTNFEFVGQETVTVRDPDTREPIGTKRGADFRSRFWPILMRRARKARAAAVNSRTIGAVTDAQVNRAAFSEPHDLREDTLDEAVDRLMGR